jgi:hypothetical protein
LIKDDEIFLNINGNIELMNTFGYLSASYYPILSYFLWMGLVYGLVGMLWTYLMMLHKS